MPWGWAIVRGTCPECGQEIVKEKSVYRKPGTKEPAKFGYFASCPCIGGYGKHLNGTVTWPCIIVTEDTEERLT